MQFCSRFLMKNPKPFVVMALALLIFILIYANLNMSAKFWKERAMSRNLVFVYGSLKQTQPNHHWLTDKENGEARLRGVATTQEKYPLVVASRYNIPYVLARPGKGKMVAAWVITYVGYTKSQFLMQKNLATSLHSDHIQIEGELYEVDDQMLAKLDILEVHPKYYERKMVKASLQESKEAVDCWIYLLHHFRPELLELPHLSVYFSKGDFVPRHLRDIQGPEYWVDVKLPEGL